jgi:membrane protease YdiL (CAAX protease family)
MGQLTDRDSPAGPVPPSERLPSPFLNWGVTIFALGYPTLLACIYFVALAGQGKGPNTASLGAYGVGKAVQFAFPLLIVCGLERRRLHPTVPSLRGLIPGVAFGLAVGAATWGLYAIFLRDWLIRIGTPQKVLVKVQECGAVTPFKYVLLALFLAGGHALLEEYYWRWFAFSWLKRSMSVAAAIALSSLAFMAHHVVVLDTFLPGHFATAAVPLSFCIAAGGSAWAWLYHRTGSICSVWLSHMLVDVAIMIVGYDLVFGHR